MFNSCRINMHPIYRYPVKSRLSFLLLVLVACVYANSASALGASDTTQPAAARQADWLTHATYLERRQDWPGLLDWGRQWTQAESTNASAWFVLGLAYGKLNRSAEAITAYRQDLAIDPADIFALNNLGNLYRDNKQLREANSAYREAVQIDPNYISAWHNLSLTFLAQKGVAGVTQALQKLSVSEPGLADAWRKLIIEYSVSRDPRVAEKATNVLRGLDAEKRRRMFEILFGNV